MGVGRGGQLVLAVLPLPHNDTSIAKKHACRGPSRQPISQPASH